MPNKLKYIKLTFANRAYVGPYAYVESHREKYNIKYYKITETLNDEYHLIEIFQDHSYMENLGKKNGEDYSSTIKAINDRKFFMNIKDWDSNDFHCYDYTKYYEIEEISEDEIILLGLH
tara:strand:- start:588 stop:944 length:357 start_codon:yes stop_codon:yes gene_type:complete